VKERQTVRPHAHLLDGAVALLLGAEIPPTDTRALVAEFFATVTMLPLLGVQLLLAEPVLSADACGFRAPLTGLA